MSMAPNAEYLHIKMEPNIKAQAEEILASLGIPVSSAVHMFYLQIIKHGRLPFAEKLPVSQPLNMNLLSEYQFNEELEKGYADMVEGRVKPAGNVFADIRRDYGI